MEATNFKNTAALTHLSALSQYLIPFANYIFPIVIWSTYKEKSEFVSAQSKQVLNFQLSLLLYSIILLGISIPILIYHFFQNIPFSTIINDNEIIIDHFNFNGHIGALSVAILALIILGILKVSEFFLIIFGAIKASNGENYRYPISIPFLK
ncbi:DUF4870 domain-containing protein [Flavobacterium agrisoli]|uniref:DUF4870 domain-containing protein n=1 Tax=Flavobacterium agrisoli TaxID=2793066 RepID=A0A934UK96_9FLAO|nr:DUF4870 domain-containing protein [Flavobacterium agrisoli]MBK0370846.1 DUF4870 domain-containing protein [Flavobacterium agrisoli]